MWNKSGKGGKAEENKCKKAAWNKITRIQKMIKQIIAILHENECGRFSCHQYSYIHISQTIWTLVGMLAGNAHYFYTLWTPINYSLCILFTPYIPSQFQTTNHLWPLQFIIDQFHLRERMHWMQLMYVISPLEPVWHTNIMSKSSTHKFKMERDHPVCCIHF